MKSTKIILASFLLLSLLSLNNTNVKALTVDKSLSTTDLTLLEENENRLIANGVLDELGEIVTNDYVIINGDVNLIYPYFKDLDIALANAKNRYSEIITTLKLKYHLGELSETNLTQYLDAISEYRTEFGLDFSYQLDICKFESFINISANSIKNANLKYLLQEKSGIKSGFRTYSSLFISESVLDLLPYYSTANKKMAEIINDKKEKIGYFLSTAQVPETSVRIIQPMTMLTSTQLTNAINYASTYAVNYNTVTYYSFSADCTNFASQILENAGIGQVNYYPDEYSGWWHYVYYFLGIKIHKHSRSWAGADTFTRYMGRSNTRVISSNYAFELFTTDISAGDFIAADWENDGSWNHIGFVAYKSSFKNTYNGMYYYDFKVAQHTNDYYAWTSSTTNGWDATDGRVYAIVRK